MMISLHFQRELSMTSDPKKIGSTIYRILNRNRIESKSRISEYEWKSEIEKSPNQKVENWTIHWAPSAPSECHSLTASMD